MPVESAVCPGMQTHFVKRSEPDGDVVFSGLSNDVRQIPDDENFTRIKKCVNIGLPSRLGGLQADPRAARLPSCRRLPFLSPRPPALRRRTSKGVLSRMSHSACCLALPACLHGFVRGLAVQGLFASSAGYFGLVFCVCLRSLSL